MRKGLQVVARSLHSSHDLGFLCGRAPDTRHVYLITGLPQSKRHITRIYAAHSPAQRHNNHLAPCRRVVDCGRNRRNCASAKFSKNEVRLEVCNRSNAKSITLNFMVCLLNWNATT
jgi:hypothetical protein